MEQNQPSSLFGLGIDQTTKAHLAETARWGRFLAIVGFIMCGLIVVMGLFFASFFSTITGGMSGTYDSDVSVEGMGAVMTVFYIIFALIYFFPCLFLFRFSAHMKQALASNDQETLNSSFQNLKVLFRYLGIITIIILAFYGIGLLIFIAGAAAMS